ncbi:putative peptidoglycan biosynthesis protein MurJ [Hartmannibacter diazotrophicus]|uniref:Probable lipid II flippase MurJ n=1 Tax=Hartmannibacter diazotrophicus TaxID=1482074 RepID=A0A2C9D1P0_9HYPH|nr:murein biosynthesis integral membrane protein MurJ [Hartmannibacter diazotrophicus]SON54160.1 putative peptidoglycan biosynthesis protein MurJ [Hartmannibacter diazotrophicus]
MNLLKNFATVGMATMVSRVLGFVRDVFMAQMLGSGPMADAFFVAFRLPNLFRRLFAEGAFNAAFVPLFARAVEEGGDEKARQFAEEVLASLLFTLLILTAVAELAMPALVYALAPGFADDAAKFDLATGMTRIMFPYLMCMSLTAMASGMLNSMGRFALAAFAPSLLNVVFVIALTFIWFSGAAGTSEAAFVLSWAVFIAGFVQLLSLVIGLRMIDFSLKLRRPRLTPGVRRLLVLGLPGVVAGGITQINIVVGTIIASNQESAVSFLYYADRLYQLPLGIVGVAIGVVLLPDLTRQLRSKTPETALHTQNRALEFSMALTLPATVALAVIPVEIIRVLFERGAFGPEDSVATGHALAAYALGLPAFVAIKVLQPAYFAREDTKTPTIYAGISMVVNVVLAIALFSAFAHVGIAAATTVAAWVNVGQLTLGLVRRGEFVFDTLLVKRLPLMLLASLLMGAGLYLGARQLDPWLTPSAGLLTCTLALMGLVLLGMVLFALFAILTGAIDVKRYGRMIFARGKG